MIPSTVRLGAVTRGAPFVFSCDGRDIPAHPGETIATALLAAGVAALRHSEGRGEGRGEPRGLFCGMGLCFECRVTVDGRANLRACMTPAAPGLRVTAAAMPPNAIPRRGEA